jgi:hypothetical protein
LIEEASAVDVPPEDSEGEGQAGKPKRNAPSTPGPNEAAPTGILSRAATAYRTGLEIGGSGKRVLKPGEVYSERL